MSSVLDVPVLLALAISLAGEPAPLDGRAPKASAAVPVGAGGAPSALAAFAAAYTDEAWLDTFRRHGAAVGHGTLARRIFKTSSGRIYAPSRDDRDAILALRQHAPTAARITTEAARANAAPLAAALGRPARLAELYAAHVLGAAAAADLLRAAIREPHRAAADVLPEVALAHRELFFIGPRPQTTATVEALLVAGFERALRLGLAAGRTHHATAPASRRATPLVTAATR